MGRSCHARFYLCSKPGEGEVNACSTKWWVWLSCAVAAACLTGGQPARAQGSGEPSITTISPDEAPARERAQELLQTRVSNLYAGAAAVGVPLRNPRGDGSAIVDNGRRDFIQFNCVGCHAPNGGGGMGPSLSDSKWIYGSEPANIYLSIVHGRPNGMPAWSAMLPDDIVWELVAYIRSITAPAPADGRFGHTISGAQLAQGVEQIPAEMLDTLEPWQHTEPFSSGQRPQAQGGEPTGSVSRE